MPRRRIAPPRPEHLRCEYRVDPLGIDVAQPRLSWEIRRPPRRQANGLSGAGGQHAGETGRRRGPTCGTAAAWPPTSRRKSSRRASRWNRGCDATGRSACGTPRASRPVRATGRVDHGPAEAGDVQAKWIGLARSHVSPPKSGRRPIPPTFDGCCWIWAAEPGVNARRTAAAGPLLPPDRDIPLGRTFRRAQIADCTADDRLNCSSTDKRVRIGSN